MKNVNQKVLELAKSGQKDRALVRMRQKKFMEKELDKLMGQEIMMDKMIGGIESAQQDLNVMKALK